jgi:hypothetical protein
MDVEKILPILPRWMAIPIILLTIILSLGPQLSKMVSSLTGRSRTYKRERERLSLLKLRYEIEALKKEKGLIDIAEPLPNFPERSVEESGPGKELNFGSRFLYGALGTLVPSFLRLSITLLQPDLSHLINAGYIVGILVLALIGGLASAVILRRATSSLLCFLVGLSLVLLLQTAMETATNGTRLRPPVVPSASRPAPPLIGQNR